MIIASWNIRGMGKRATHRALKDLIQGHNPDIVFLMETKIDSNRLERHRHSLGFKEGFYQKPVGTTGGLALWWRANVKIDVLDATPNLIDAVLETEKAKQWFCSFSYGSPYPEEKDEVFDKLQSLRSDADQPWCLIGDFNEIRFQSEKQGGLTVDNRRVDSFNSFIFDNDLCDLPIQGGDLTWDNHRINEEFIAERLDRVLFNPSWNILFPHCFGKADLAIESDHKPIILNLEKKNKRSKRMFRFESKWLLDEECSNMIKDLWKANEGGDLFMKLNNTMEKLQEWNSEKWRNSKQKQVEIKEKIAALELQPRTAENRDAIKLLKRELDRLWKAEEMHWHIRSSINWMMYGDKNTRFFHASTLFNRKRNRIARLMDQNGDWLEDEAEIAQCIENYFREKFKADAISNVVEAVESIPKVISQDTNRVLEMPITKEELKSAAFSMGPYKSPGPDGFSGQFYQSFWPQVEDDLLTMSQNFLANGFLPEALNHSHLVLIPKSQGPESLDQYRPISLCNFAYKIISKVMTNRMKPIMSEFIHPAQSAFISGRQIQDNIMVSHECFIGLKKRKKQIGGAFAIKLDLAKAYDKVNWDFLDLILRKLGFSDIWVDRVMLCVRSVSFSVLVNGVPTDSFKPEKGLRQGDPLSPYLFIMVANVLSTLIEKACDDGRLKGYVIKKGCPPINHLMFADDCLLFGYDNQDHVNAILSILEIFQNASGQKVNFSKSSIFFSTNMKQMDRERILESFNMSMMDPNSRYLGLPSIWGRGKKEALQFVLDKVRSKIQGWKGKFLSQAGREILLKAVATAIPTYVMQVFRLPSTFCDDLNNLLCKFWWRGPDIDKNHTHWMSWKRLSKTKDCGGMGFRDFNDFNKRSLESKHGELSKTQMHYG